MHKVSLWYISIMLGMDSRFGGMNEGSVVMQRHV